MRMLHSPLFWLGVLLLLAGGIIAARKVLRPQDTEQHPPAKDEVVHTAPKGEQVAAGFKEIVKDPQLWHDLVAAREDVTTAIAQAKSWSREQRSAALRQFVFETKNS